MARPTIDLESPAPPDEAAPVRAARAYFYGECAPSEIGPLPDEVAEALVTTLARHEDVAKLTALAAATDKALAKRARKGLHLLRTRGLAVDVPLPTQPAPARPATTSEPEAQSLASTWVRDGERIVWLARNDAEGRVEVYQAQMSDRYGMTKFEALRASRKHWRQAMHDFFADEALPVAPVPGAVARAWIERAAERTVEAGRQPLREMEESRPRLGPSPALARHPIHDVLDDATLAAARAALPTRAAALFRLPELVTWIPEEETARRAYLALEELATSQLVVDERQRREQAVETVHRHARELLATPWRQRFAQRLLDTALVVAERARVAGAKAARDFHTDAALVAAAGLEAADASVPVEGVHAVHALFERLIEIPSLQGPPRETTTPAGLVVPVEPR